MMISFECAHIGNELQSLKVLNNRKFEHEITKLGTLKLFRKERHAVRGRRHSPSCSVAYWKAVPPCVCRFQLLIVLSKPDSKGRNFGKKTHKAGQIKQADSKLGKRVFRDRLNRDLHSFFCSLLGTPSVI